MSSSVVPLIAPSPPLAPLLVRVQVRVPSKCVPSRVYNLEQWTERIKVATSLAFQVKFATFGDLQIKVATSEAFQVKVTSFEAFQFKVATSGAF